MTARQASYSVLKKTAALTSVNIFQVRGWLDRKITHAIESHAVAFREDGSVVARMLLGERVIYAVFQYDRVMAVWEGCVQHAAQLGRPA